MNEAKLASFMKKMPKDIVDEYTAAAAQVSAESKSAASGSGRGPGRGKRPWITAVAVLATVALF